MLLRIHNLETFVEAVSVANLGSLTLQVAIALTLAMAAMVGVGMMRKDERLVHIARRSQYLVTIILMVASAILYLMIFDGLYVSSYVYHISENQEIPFFKITGLWASQQGSLLFWSLVLSICGSAFAFTSRHARTDRRLPATLLTLFLIEVFFLYLMMFDRSNPFCTVFEWMSYGHIHDLSVEQFLVNLQGEKFVTEGIDGTMVTALRNAVNLDPSGEIASLNMGALHATLSGSAETIQSALMPHFSDGIVQTFSDGKGMNPQLHNYWIAIHPPTLYFGYIGFTIPFCLAVGSLISGELDADWIRRARLWTMVSWTFLTAGIAMGGLWAYEILGWGGYWAWDPVENASFIPWLTATAFIHSVVVQERRGMLKVWNVALIILTYTLTIIGTFLVRSGIISSVHAFGDTGLITPLVVFMVTVFLGSILLIVWRMPLLKPDRKLMSVVSREGVFLINNLVLCLIALGTLTMTLWPVITKFLFGNEGRYEFAGEAYLLVNGPLFLLLIFMTSVGPLLPYGKGTKREILRQLAWPAALGISALAINAVGLIAGDHLVKTVEGQDTVSWLVTIVRQVMQLTIPAIAVMIVSASLQEVITAGRLRKRATNTNIVMACFDAVLANRRRFGGYICHIGIALVAVGIYVSSFYEIDTSAEIPQGGYALIGDGPKRLAFVSEDSESSEVYRDLRVMMQAKSQLEGIGNPQSNPRAYAYWTEVYQRSSVLREALLMSHQLRLENDLTLDGYLTKRFGEVDHLMRESFTRISDPTRRQQFMGALSQFMSDQTMTPSKFLQGMNMGPASAKMSESLNLAYSVVHNSDALTFVEAISMAPEKLAAKGYEVVYGEFRATLENALAAQWKKAQSLANGKLSHEFIASSLRIFEVELTPLSDDEHKVFGELMRGGLEAFSKSLEVYKADFNADELTLQKAARDASEAEAFKKLVNFALLKGVVVQAELDREEQEAKAGLPALRAFNTRLRGEVFEREAEITQTLLLDFGKGTRTQAEVDEHMAAYGFRATGGLQEVLKLAETSTEEGASVATKPEVLKAIDAAQTALTALHVGSFLLEPQIKVFYDKRTGQPRNLGEAVRDPQIERTLTNDLYAILQDVDIAESPANFERRVSDLGMEDSKDLDIGKDRFIYRIFVKPGMNIGLVGLLVMILGAFFALLPTRRRAPRAALSVKAKRGSE